MPHIRIVGDVHGKLTKYIDIVREHPYSIQVGDLGFSYDCLSCLDFECHKFFGGNHDNYDVYYETPHALGDYGEFELGGYSLYFIRGGFSIDKKYRIRSPIKVWWEEEELPRRIYEDVVGDFESVKPKIVLTHSCPQTIARKIGNDYALRMFGFDPSTFSTNTQLLLEECINVHQPELWVFGHFHKDVELVYKGTRFVCLPELGVLDYDG